jgi:periplasmic copper chaperone A
MHKTNLNLLALLVAVGGAHAHVVLPPGGAAPGSIYPAAFRVGHACKDATATTAIKVRVPDGFVPLEALPRPGWTVSVAPTEVSWTAATPAAALPAGERTSFVVRGRLTDKPGTLWFKVLQVCDKGSADWAEVPRDGARPAFPAARLDVLPLGVAPVDVRDAWARLSVPGQSATGVFAKLTAPAGSRLVGGSTPVAASVEIHEMTMDGDVMRMRALDAGLDLPPAETVELKPGGYHLMLAGLLQPLPAGSSVPLRLRFVDRDGRTGEIDVQVPVMVTPFNAAANHRH